MCLCILFVGHLFKNRDIKESSFSLSALTTRLYDTLIQRYDKKSFHFKYERLTEILQAVRCHIL